MEASPPDRPEVIMIIPLTPLRFLRYSSPEFTGRHAVVCGDQRLTYAQCSYRPARQAGALRSLGVDSGERVAFLGANCHRLLEGYYGVVEAGGILLPLNIRLASQELAYILNDSEADVLFFEEQFIPLIESFGKDLTSVKHFIPLDFKPNQPWMSPKNY